MENNLTVLIAFILALFISVAVIAGVDFLFDLLRQNTGVPADSSGSFQASDLKEDDIFLEHNNYFSSNKLLLVSNISSRVLRSGDPKSVEGREMKKFVRRNGEIESGYLFVNVSVNDGSLTQWDRVYVSLRQIIDGYDYTPVHGHLVAELSKEVPYKKGSTRLLFDLRRMPLITNIYQPENYRVEDWAALINEEVMFEFETFISTLQDGFINEIYISYKCVPGTDCSLEVVEDQN